MKILHTSDWHLGRTLYGRRRYPEFTALLDWLISVIEHQQVDTLLVAGDIFDTTAPGNRAQELYYRFLGRVAAVGCRHVVIIAGNHDSPTFLNAPRELLRAMDVHVVGAATADPADVVLLLTDQHQQPELLVAAVPYLRDRDLRLAEPGESLADKERKLLAGLREHYARVAAIIEERRQTMARPVPAVAMGHLFTAGGQTVEGDGVRELYVGSLAHVPAGQLPDNFDYLALGHLHVPQRVGGTENRRYSGSPLPLSFGEAGQQKSICLVELQAGQPAAVTTLPVPVFQPMERIRGNWDEIDRRLVDLAAGDCPCWLEIVYEGEEVIPELRQRLEEKIAGSEVEILRIINQRLSRRLLEQTKPSETLDDLDPYQVFQRCLEAHAIPPEQQPPLLQAYRETVTALLEEDHRAE
ncbi:exonuclease SbcCD subunit D C-terminal domain-containing protein [Desulfurivibrio dismutans]|uniref:exonuclease SbcCD subunit D C-terminal domain-containing protein n=1 Tax=Desulfurivibrio dismutans TaxID=1398908 RepID=UPI0023DA00B8|nr:exonuclease SbcCD subunit D C-terminal domain-containing protein [Desulfurivibrio alkaliphilus]MDF1613705.1 exonuclease SbcCD subunit D C-terminal domain-containing protein [Desulfurivibrio alkaliphilus]